MISEQISHYRILSKLGAGGMGEVYLAEDVKLRRLETAFHTSGIEGFWRELYRIELEGADVKETDSYKMAQICSRLKETDAAFEWLEKAYHERASRIMFLAVDP